MVPVAARRHAELAQERAAHLLAGAQAAKDGDLLLAPVRRLQLAARGFKALQQDVVRRGVSAGVEFAIILAARLWGDEAARELELAIEYDPQPVFGTGSPERAGPELTGRVAAKWSGFLEATRQAVREAATRLAERGAAAA